MFKDFLLGFLVHIVQLQYRELGLAERGVWLGSNWRSSVLVACKQPSFFMGAWPTLYDHPKQVGHNADTDMISPGSMDPSFSKLSTILASHPSSLDYRREPILPAEVNSPVSILVRPSTTSVPLFWLLKKN